MKSVVDEIFQNFSKRFNKVYESIPAHIKPSVGAAQLRYAEEFDYELSIMLRQRESPSLAEM